MCVEFAIDSRAHIVPGVYSEFRWFFAPHRPTFLNSNAIGYRRATGLSVVRLLCDIPF